MIFLVKGNSLVFYQYLFNYVLVVIWHSGLNIADAILEDCFSGAEKRKGTRLLVGWRIHQEAKVKCPISSAFKQRTDGFTEEDGKEEQNVFLSLTTI